MATEKSYFSEKSGEISFWNQHVSISVTGPEFFFKINSGNRAKR
jgi:hypothetical protein